MKRFLLILVAAIAAAGAVVVPSQSASAPRITLTDRHGPDIRLAPGEVRENYNVYCPSGHYATGFGMFKGGLDLVYAMPTPRGRGYQFAFANPTETTITAAGVVMCATGDRGLRARATAFDKEGAIRDAKAALAAR